jgi:hypothetical protein
MVSWSRKAGGRVGALAISWLMVSPLRGIGCHWHHARVR